VGCRLCKRINSQSPKNLIIYSHSIHLGAYTKIMTRQYFSFFAGLILLLSHNHATADNGRAALEQWLETRRVESRERADWKLERELLVDSQRFLHAERERLQELLEDLSQRQDATAMERHRLNAEREGLDATAAAMIKVLPQMEQRLLGLAAGFPDPLRAQLAPLLRRLASAEKPGQVQVGLAERLQNIVGILTEADKFNATLTLTREIRDDLQNGIPAIEVRTLYVGISMAYFVDGSGRHAGVGYPGSHGWQWQVLSNHAVAIGNFIDDYEGSGQIRLVRLPAEIRPFAD
jgi:hypothetical protein